MDIELLKAIGYIFGIVIVSVITFFTGKKYQPNNNDNPIVTEARLLQFKDELDNEYAKKEELSAVMGKFDKFLESFNQFKFDISNQMGAMNTSIAVMAEAMKYLPKRKED
jgi:hypothetical protein